MHKLQFSSFRKSVFAVMCALVMLSQAMTFLLFDYVGVKNAQNLILQDNEKTILSFQSFINQRFLSLTEKAEFVAVDYGFKSAIATFESETVQSALLNYKRRLGADFMAVFAPERSFFESTLLPDSYGESVRALSPLTLKIKERGYESATGVFRVNNILYQASLIPVKAPEIIAYVAIGFALDKSVALDFKERMFSDITFLTFERTEGSMVDRGGVDIVASTTDQFSLDDFLEDINTGDVTANQKYRDFISQIAIVRQDNEDLNFVVVLQKSWRGVFEAYTLYRTYFLFLTALLLIFTIPAAIFLSGKVTRPVYKLLKASERVAQGDYSVRVFVDQTDELGLLASRFNEMVKGLVERERMEFLAYHDGLTGLGNRRLLKQKIGEALSAYKDAEIPSVLFLIDLDNFKPVNDTHGHDAGDTALIEVASRLDSFASSEDEWAIRLGGDEFALLLKENADDKGFVETKAELLINVISEPIRLHDGGYVDVGASIGVAYCYAGLTREVWLKEADKACYSAKDAGKNVFKSFPEDT